MGWNPSQLHRDHDRRHEIRIPRNPTRMTHGVSTYSELFWSLLDFVDTFLTKCIQGLRDTCFLPQSTNIGLENHPLPIGNAGLYICSWWSFQPALQKHTICCSLKVLNSQTSYFWSWWGVGEYPWRACFFQSFFKELIFWFQEISNGRTHWMDPEKTWVSNSSIPTYKTGSVGIRSHLILDGQVLSKTHRGCHCALASTMRRCRWKVWQFSCDTSVFPFSTFSTA